MRFVRETRNRILRYYFLSTRLTAKISWTISCSYFVENYSHGRDTGQKLPNVLLTTAQLILYCTMRVNSTLLIGDTLAENFILSICVIMVYYNYYVRYRRSAKDVMCIYSKNFVHQCTNLKDDSHASYHIKKAPQPFSMITCHATTYRIPRSKKNLTSCFVSQNYKLLVGSNLSCISLLQNHNLDSIVSINGGQGRILQRKQCKSRSESKQLGIIMRQKYIIIIEYTLEVRYQICVKRFQCS